MPSVKMLEKTWEVISKHLQKDGKAVRKETLFEKVCDVDGLVLKYADSKIRDNTKIVKIATENNSNAVEFASLRIRSDKKFMLSMIEQDAMNLEFASANIQDDEDVKTITKEEALKIINDARETAFIIADEWDSEEE